ncbi:MAG TPA: DUF4291 domain-containing protein [Blastocatellia bacterium]
MRKIFASYDEQGVWVYQAFKPSIVEAALRRGTFDKGFSLDRMTWIKPSFGWVLYRSGYASKHRQEAVLKIKITHEGFREILSQSVETSFNPDLYESENHWRLALSRSDVRHQWDPDRSLTGERLERRAIQIGIRGETVQKYVRAWIVQLEEVTELAKQIGQTVEEKRRDMPQVPDEIEYLVSRELQQRLGIMV